MGTLRVNRARMLLLNIDTPAGGGAPSHPGDELLEPGFRAVALPGHLASVRARLFGSDPDRVMLNYRAQQLLAVTHATPFGAYLTALDPRITYDTASATFLDPGVFTPAATPIAAGRADRIAVFGTPTEPDGSGRAALAYLVSVPGDGTIEVVRTAPPPPAAYATPVGTPAPLPGSGYSCRVAASAGASWRVDVVRRPRRDLGQLVASLDRAGAATLDALFGVGPAEPYRTFANLWYDQSETPLRLAGLVLALVYRTDALRGGD